LKPKVVPQTTPAGPVRVEYEVAFSRGPRGRRRAKLTQPERELKAEPAPTDPETVPSPDIPKRTKMLVLGYYFERLVQEGKVRDYAEIARMTGLSRARVTQLCNMTLLDLCAQEALLRR